MAFATVLDGFCVTLKCSNSEIAKRCGMSSSTLSRYRNGRRIPSIDSGAIEELARGIAGLARERGIMDMSSQEEISQALKASLSQGQPLGMGFAARLDSLMQLLGIRNMEIAKALRLDSSYISRIRHGERTPSDKGSIAETAAQIATMRCMELDVLDEVLDLFDIGESTEGLNVEDTDSASRVVRAIKSWLLGSKITDADVEALLELFGDIDQGYYEWVLRRAAQPPTATMCASLLDPTMQFYRGDGFMWKAELGFLEHALECGAHSVIISSDMPALETVLPDAAIEEYQEAVADLVRNGCHITIIQSLDRDLRESIRAMWMWIPLYMTGNVAPLYLSGMTSQLLCHTNSVCECCAMASEAVRGNEEDGQYFISTRPEDISYYQKKMNYIKEKASIMLEVYHGDDEEGMAKFERDEAFRLDRDALREVCADRYQNLKIISYADCIVLSVKRAEEFHFVIRHPKLRYVVSHLQ